MPADSFIPTPVFDLTGPPSPSAVPAPEPAPDVPASGPPPPPPPSRRKRDRRRRNRRNLAGSVRTVLCDRLEQAIAAGVVVLIPDDMPADTLDFTLAEVALLMRVMLPEEYAGPRRQAVPTGTAPGSAERVAEYARRVSEGEELFAAGDATAGGAGRGLKVVQRSNGTGPRVVGWQDEYDHQAGELAGREG